MSDALLLVGDSETNQNLYYKTHFLAGDPFVYFEHGDRRVLVVGGMERGRAEKESIVPEIRTFEDFNFRQLVSELGDRTRAFATMLQRLTEGAGEITVEGTFPVMYADALRAQGVTLRVDNDLLDTERRTKSEEEVDAIERAQAATERAVAHAFEILSSSETHDSILHYNGVPLTAERLRTEIETLLVRDGMVPVTPIVAPGPGASDPHWLGEGPIRAGQAIVFDVFPRDKASRYYADMTRTVVRGEPEPQLQAMFDAVVAGQEAAFGMIRAGANGREVHEATAQAMRDAGFDREDDGPRYIHSTGHGVGLNIHEGPGLGTRDDELREGDVITVEPGLYDPEIGGVRMEDMVVVTADGYRNLTNFPKRFVL